MRGSKGKEYVAGIGAGLLAGAVFLILLFGLRWSIWIDIILAGGSYVGLALLLKPVRRIGTVSFDMLPDGEEMEKYLSDAREDHDVIEKALWKISNRIIKEEAEKLNQTAGTIISYLEEHPDKIKLARQFIDYYQDTAASILKRYVELEDTNLNTSDVMKLKEDTLKSLQTLNVAFDRQFQKLLRNEMMDMDAQMRLLEQTVKMEEVHK